MRKKMMSCRGERERERNQRMVLREEKTSGGERKKKGKENVDCL
jgi:hypothetical protein